MNLHKHSNIECKRSQPFHCSMLSNVLRFSWKTFSFFHRDEDFQVDSTDKIKILLSGKKRKKFKSSSLRSTFPWMGKILVFA